MKSVFPYVFKEFMGESITFLLQTGDGHFSPIGGYHAGKDMALILDVARFKYPPHWVPLTLLWEAMDNVAGTTGQRRGLVLPHTAVSKIFCISLLQMFFVCILEAIYRSK